MNKDQVMKVTFTFFANGRFEARSPFLPSAFGLGETAEEAMKDFEASVDEWVDATGGNPPEPQLHEQLFAMRRETERVLYQIRDEFNCSLNEALDILAARYSYMALPSGPDPTDPR